MRHLYLAATGQNRGKTTASVGLMDLFLGEGLRTGFMKPVGQRTIVDEAGVPADEDAVLVKAVYDLREPMTAMSPVHIPRGFTKAYIAGTVVEDLGARIAAAHATFVADKEVLLIEGTGHAGVGAVIGLSNAVVAALLRAPAVIVSEGGVGRPIDEIVLNASHFAAHGVPVAGAIVNKVNVDTQPGIAAILEKGLARHGIPLLGVIPYRPMLSNPSLAMILEGTRADLLVSGPDLDLVIGGISVAAMEAHHVLQHVIGRRIVIVAGDREDVIVALSRAHRAEMRRPAVIHGEAEPSTVGFVLSGYRPRPAVVDEIRRADLFACFLDEDTYMVASDVHDLLVKTHASDRGKIEMIKSIVAASLDADRILAAATEAA
ncbi:MAG TPA: AAA family ATPase [Candidatus Nanopelagicales bacterium]|nr:AAA family ATPase [Candidatus Nanopelagicales bacterium]